MLYSYAHNFIAFIILNAFLITHCYQFEKEIEDEVYDNYNFEYHEPEYDVSQYILYFKSYNL